MIARSRRSAIRTRELGRHLQISEFGLGTSPFGNLFHETTNADTQAATAISWDGGVRYFDTAPHYGLGLAERRLGAALRQVPPGSPYLVSTKVGRRLVPTPQNAHLQDDGGFVVPATHRREFDFSRDGILRSVEGSLERLGRDDVDILYLHDPDDHWEQASTTGIETLIELREQGVVRAIGAGMNQSAMLAEFIRRCDVDVVMLAGRYTLLDQSALDDLLPLAQQRGVGVVAAGVYNSGLLGRDEVPDQAHYEYRPAPPELIARARRLAEVCRRHGATLPQAAVQFPLRHPAVAAVVVGARDASQAAENLARYQAELPAALWEELEDSGFLRAEHA